MTPCAGAPRTDPTSSFLVGLSQVAHHPLVARAEGTILLELRDRGVETHWLVTIDRGHIEVANHPGPAEAVVRMPQRLFASAVQGCSNLWTAILRGDVVVEGDLHLVTVFQRLLPGPPLDRTTSGGPGPQS